jgi:hypothetical protein
VPFALVQAFTVVAEELDDTARAGLWPKLIADAPRPRRTPGKTARKIPVFMLTRQD